jgi:hypothetical protein
LTNQHARRFATDKPKTQKTQKEKPMKLFTKKITPDGLMKDFRQMSESCDTEISELKFKSKRLKGRVEAILNRGKECAAKGDTIGMRQAAIELKRTQLLAAKQEKKLLKAIDTQTCVEVKMQDLEHSSQSQLGKVCESLGRIMKDPQFQRVMGEARYGSSEFDAQIISAVDRAFEELNGESESLDVDTSIFVELNEADKAGDVDKVVAIKRRVGARVDVADVEEPALA